MTGIFGTNRKQEGHFIRLKANISGKEATDGVILWAEAYDEVNLRDNCYRKHLINT